MSTSNYEILTLLLGLTVFGLWLTASHYRAEAERARRLNRSLAERVRAQSELLSRRAEKE